MSDLGQPRTRMQLFYAVLLIHMHIEREWNTGKEQMGECDSTLWIIREVQRLHGVIQLLISLMCYELINR